METPTSTSSPSGNFSTNNNINRNNNPNKSTQTPTGTTTSAAPATPVTPSTPTAPSIPSVVIRRMTRSSGANRSHPYVAPTPTREDTLELPPYIQPQFATGSSNNNGSATTTPNNQITPKKRENEGAVRFTYEVNAPRSEGTIQRYWISAKQSPLSAALASKTPVSYRHLIDLTSSNIQCTDIQTGEEFLCKIVNEPIEKVQKAYFALQQDKEGCRSTIYGHSLIRGIHDTVPLSKNRTYIIISPVTQPEPTVWDTNVARNMHRKGVDNWGVYEDLHTYIRNKKRLCENEARYLFHQICQTVQVCHRNGIILRDLKLKRFFFIDEARTKLQYESLEGSMILNDLNSDVLSDKIGCPLYTAPELLCPNPTYHGKPADMWSLGVILYTMLVGQYPFYEKGNCNLITVIRHCHVQIPSSLSRSVRWLLLALLRKNYEERMTANQIFISPWLKEQRPFYTYIPADIEIPESENEENDDKKGRKELLNEDDVDLGVQPLDYTCATLSSRFGNASINGNNAFTATTRIRKNPLSLNRRSSVYQTFGYIYSNGVRHPVNYQSLHYGGNIYTAPFDTPEELS